MGVVNWNTLPLDLIPRIADLLLSDDPIDLLCLRAVCRAWRSLSPNPRSLASRFRPRRWIMLSDGSADLTVPQTFLNLSTGRSLRISLPDLYGHWILASTDGLLVLFHQETSLVRLFNPFCRFMVDLPPLLGYNGNVFSRDYFGAAMSYSDGTDDDPTVVLSWDFGRYLFGRRFFWAKLGDQTWMDQTLMFKSENGLPDFKYNPRVHLFFQGSFYITNVFGRVYSLSLDGNLLCELVFPDRQPGWDDQLSKSYLVECDSSVLVVLSYCATGQTGPPIEVYKADLDNNRLVLIESIGDYALFVGHKRMLSVSAKGFPSLRGNSIYMCTGQLNDPVIIYDLESHQCEPISGQTVIHNGDMQLRPSVRPFTLPDHLVTYCSHPQWAKGLMYHEFPKFPRAWSAKFNYSEFGVLSTKLNSEFRWGISQGYPPF
ncbi:ascorbic acid mannose pathway regulator 1 [Rhynchospora pubera]|uniref:Ascorbic acid mannose pathway regulator 1 n=1 Tax=Rhynchospora pubera TaxID=906938 RepID=A0AAV8FQ48_9POAL|nr:ascorbic acid mannose pathway regulator 1 [Rhynchospora pubera]